MCVDAAGGPGAPGRLLAGAAAVTRAGLATDRAGLTGVALVAADRGQVGPGLVGRLGGGLGGLVDFVRSVRHACDLPPVDGPRPPQGDAAPSPSRNAAIPAGNEAGAR